MESQPEVTLPDQEEDPTKEKTDDEGGQDRKHKERQQVENGTTDLGK